MEKKIPMTQQGYNKLEEELRHLKNVERPTVIKAI
ncbi:MAG: transcription elongation factor GreA, partial [Alphaproteobacteria bacterium]